MTTPTDALRALPEKWRYFADSLYQGTVADTEADPMHAQIHAWANELEAALASQPRVDAGAVEGRPNVPGIYKVSGFHLGHPEDFAVVEVIEQGGELLTNLHERNSDRHSWSRVEDCNERFKWTRVDTPLLPTGNAALVSLLEQVRDLLASRPADCLGDGLTTDGQAYPIRDEVIDGITRALAQGADHEPR